MDFGGGDSEGGVDKIVTPCEEEMQQTNADVGSPMQQSPDRTDINGTSRSPENAEFTVEEDHMDTNENKTESAGDRMESDEVLDMESDHQKTTETETDSPGVEGTNVPDTENLEVPDQIGSIDDHDEQDKENLEEESLKEAVSDMEGVTNEGGPSQSESETSNEENLTHQVRIEKPESVENGQVENSEVSAAAESNDKENDNEISNSGKEEETVDKMEDDHFECNPENVNSNTDSVSDSDIKHTSENAEEESHSLIGSPKVSSSAQGKDMPEQLDNVEDDSEERNDSFDVKTEENESSGEEDQFKYPTKFDKVPVSNIQTVEDLGLVGDSSVNNEHMAASSSVDNFSTRSLKGSSDSESDDDIDLDLTNIESEKQTLEESNLESDSVSSSTNYIEESIGKQGELEVKSIDKQGELEEEAQSDDTENETGENAQASEEMVKMKPDTELEEVSEDEDGLDDKETEIKHDSLSGMEEVSSEEEEEDEEDVEQEEKKAESGMEEVSDEEEEEGEAEEGSAESGVENVSSDEEEQEEDNKVEKDKVDEERTVEVKQNEEVIIDDTGKDDSDIVKEILDKMTIKIENKREDKVHVDTSSKRRKSKDKKERRESAKPKSKSSFRDTRDINERLKAQASYGDDVELDYDDTVHEEGKDKQGSESEGEIMSDSSSSDGEIEEEECEEGEIKEPGQRPFVKPKCRFFMRGHCTWGINCRFLHPGVNDKGYYQLIERPGFNNRPPQQFEEKVEEEEVERTPSPEPPPPPPEPKEETAWERGLRQAKELRRKALERREMETNFEHKKMNLSIEDNPEFDKENVDEVEKPVKKSPVKKTPYYDKYEPLSDDEYYDQTPMRQQQKQMEQSWMPGRYENFEVYWSQDQFAPPQQGSYPPQRARYPYPNDHPGRGRERPPLRPSPRRYSMSPPPLQRQSQRPVRPVQQQRSSQEMVRRGKVQPEQMTSAPPKHPATTGRGKPKADDWNDPWTRANATKGKSPKKRSRSRGRRRSRRSYSYSSYSSSSYSGSSRSRSRSSSYSSVSSRSSRSSSYSRSRSPPPRPSARRAAPAPNQPVRRPSAPTKPNEPPRSAVSARGRTAGRVPVKRPGVVSNSRPAGPHASPTKAPRAPAPGPGKQPPSRSAGQQIADVGRSKKPPPQKTAGPPPQAQRKFQMAVKARDRPLPQSAFNKDKGKPKPPPRRRKASSSSSRSRSRSRSSSSSSRSSFSSGSSYSRSRSRSRSSSTSSSGSADSDHLYRNIGARDNPKSNTAGRGPTDAAKHGRMPAPGQVRAGIKPGETSRPSSVAQAKVVKDPLKMTGLKQNIKLTLIKQSDKPPPGLAPESAGRKRPPPEPGLDAPPLKRPSVANPPKIDKPVKKPEKSAPVPPAKAPGRPPGVAKPAPKPAPKPATGAPAAAAAAMATVKKKSTVSRREELLKQLKAVEDAIAKKKKKMG